MSLKTSNNVLKFILNDLNKVGIPVTGVYMPTDETDGGIEIDGRYTLQVAPYNNPPLVLDRVNLPGEEVMAFSNTDTLIQFLMEEDAREQ